MSDARQLHTSATHTRLRTALVADDVPRPRTWIVPAVLAVLQFLTCCVLLAVGVHYDHARMTPGPVLWLAIALMVSPWLALARREHRKGLEYVEQERSRRDELERRLAAIPEARILAGLAEMAKQPNTRITGVLDAVQVQLEQRPQIGEGDAD